MTAKVLDCPPPKERKWGVSREPIFEVTIRKTQLLALMALSGKAE